MGTTAAPRVLVVDDDPAWIELIGQALRQVLPAASIEAAVGGDMALARVADAPVDLVLLDLDMPGVDGREVLERLAAGERPPSVVVVSGSSRGPDVELCRRMASAHVAKPDSLDDLVEVLRRVVAPSTPAPVPPTRVVVVGDCPLPADGLQLRTVATPEAVVDRDLARWADCAVAASSIVAGALRALVPSLPVVVVSDETGARDALPRAELTPSSLQRAIRHATERVAFDELLVHQAQHDPLTALPTRALLVERLAAALEASGPHGTVVGVCVVEVADLGSVNDRYGRAVGDQVLVAVGDRLRSAVRPTDTVARISGTRFAVCCESIEDASVAEAVAVRVAWALHAPVELVSAGTVHVHASVGVATTATSPAEVEALLDAALGASTPFAGEAAAAVDADELADALDELDRFAYAASHDLRSPLASVTALLDLLEGAYGSALEGDGRQWIGLIRSGIGRMAGVADGLVAYRAAGAAVPNLAPVDLHILARAELAPMVRTAGATFTLSALPVVLGDPALLTEVLRHVVANALTYVAPGAVPRVRLSAERAADAWVVRIDDDGIGIPAAQRDRALQLFGRLHGVEAYPGAGVGLAVAARLAARMGGRLWLDDAPGGVGCRVCVSLPAA